jgi:KUP system potassium uptake protein
MTSKITIANTPTKATSDSTLEEHLSWPRPDVVGASTSIAGGIYFGRTRSFEKPERRRSVSHQRTFDSNVAVEGEDWRRDDGKKKQVFRGKTLFWYGILQAMARCVC